MTQSVELRCSASTRRLFAKVQSGEAPDPKFVDGNLVEFACPDCRREMGKDQVRMVLHRFNVLGDLVETEVVPG